MQSLAVGLVILSAIFHSIWNLLAKRSGDPLAFLFSIQLVGLLVYGIPAMIELNRHPLPASSLPFVLFSAVFEIGYFVSLAEAYRNGALALTYPVARGSGLLLVAILAVPIYREIPSLAGGIGIAAIFLALVVLGVESLRTQQAAFELNNRRGLFFAGAAGCCIASYSLIDKAGVSRVEPLVYVYVIIALTVLAIAPFVLLRRRAALAREWRSNLRSVLIGGVLSLGVYFIVLSALRLANVSYVVPLREISIVFGMLLGVLVLHERLRSRQIAAAALIIFGVLSIAFGG